MNWTEGGKYLAVTALVAAFPPVFTTGGRAEGLKVSFSFLLLYLVRGLLQFLVDALVSFGGPVKQGGGSQGTVIDRHTVDLFRRAV